ncbi:hypothetical protein TNCV_3053881 [Trichonephila clavipes]|nr:hypothetical protein TNCV_3053881 [Trichonephila clavipes]
MPPLVSSSSLDHGSKCRGLSSVHLVLKSHHSNTVQGGCGSPVVKVSDHDRHVVSSSPVPLKTRRVGQRCTLNLSRAQTSSIGVLEPSATEDVKSFVTQSPHVGVMWNVTLPDGRNRDRPEFHLCRLPSVDTLRSSRAPLKYYGALSSDITPTTDGREKPECNSRWKKRPPPPQENGETNMLNVCSMDINNVLKAHYSVFDGSAKQLTRDFSHMVYTAGFQISCSLVVVSLRVMSSSSSGTEDSEE